MSRIPGIHLGSMPPGPPRGEPEDLGPFCVWWYTLDRNRFGLLKPPDKRWAYALRDGVVWRISACVGHFATRDAAIAAARARCAEFLNARST